MLSRRQVRSLFLVSLVLGAGLAGAAPASSDGFTVPEGVPFLASNGPDITAGTQLNLSYTVPFPDKNTVKLESKSGTVTFSSPARTDATIDHIGDTWTNVSAINTTDADLTINRKNGEKVKVGGDIDTINITEISSDRLVNGEVDFYYGGASGTSNITIYNVPEETNLALYDLDNGTILDVSKSNAQGVVEFAAPNSEHKVDLRQINDPPYVDSSSPRKGAYRSNRTVQLNATVVDPDGSDVEVEVQLWNQTTNAWDTKKTTTVTSGSEVTTSVQSFKGSNKWRVKMTSQGDGEQGTSANFTYRTPGEVKVYNGTDMALLDSQQVNWTVTSMESNFQRTGNTTNGLIDLEGVPKESLRVEVASDGFTNQTLSFSQPSVNRSAVLYATAENETFTQTFAIDDRTGSYPATDTTLVVEAHFNGEWREIASETFGGANKADVVLTDNRTYRLSVRNQEGDVRQLSAYTADINQADKIVVLTIEQVDPPADTFGDLGYSWDATFNDPDGKDPYLQLVLDTRVETSIDDLQVVIYKQGDESTELYNNTFGLLSGSLVLKQPLTASQANKTWVVEFTGEVNGEKITGRRAVGRFKTETGFPLDGIWPKVMVSGFLVIVGGLYGGVNRRRGAVVIALMGGLFWYASLLPAKIAGGAIVAALALAVFYNSRLSGRI